MGLSSNQARFLSLTARQIDLEHRVQQICQRRLRLSNDLQRAANAYNDQTSDRRLYINTLNSYSSANNVIGNITHDNISDNQQYEVIDPFNLYDNGYHLFVNGKLLEINGGTIMIPLGDPHSEHVDTAGPHYNVGDWPSAFPNHKVMSKTLGTPVITNPLPTDSGTVSNSSTTQPTVGVANTTQINSQWASNGYVQNPTNGYTTQTWTRTCSVQTPAGTITQVIPVTQTSIAQLGTPSPTVTNINGVDFKQYTYTDYTNTQVTRLAIGDVSEQQAKDQLNALAGVAGTISNNFILMRDVTLYNNNWGVINNLSGTFDGNLHTISNLKIQTGTNNLGFFGKIETGGVVKNLTLDSVLISTATGAYEIGALAGSNYGTVKNVHVSDLLIDIHGQPGGTTDVNYGKGNDAIGGLVGGNCGTVDRVSASGEIRIDVPVASVIALDGVGSLIGVNGSTSSLVSSSMADVDIITDASNLECVNTFLGCDAIAGAYQNCFSTSKILNLDGSSRTTTEVGCQDQYFSGHNAGTQVTDCYKILSDGNYAYWNGTVGNPIANSGAYNNSTNQWSSQEINGTPIWDTTTTPPQLNFSTLNNEQVTVAAHTTTTWTETETRDDDPGVYYMLQEFQVVAYNNDILEPGLRDGTIKLAKHADPMTQEVITAVGSNETFEYVDWRVVPIIADDLYKVNDEEAQYQYEKITREVNTQDKQLQLEQTSVETEYNAVRSEKEAVEKVIDANAKSSFKYFS